jgi:integrase
MKTENTLRNHAKDVIVPIFSEIKALIEKLEVKSSPYILGHLSKGYNENTFRSQKDWQLQKVRRGLKILNDKLKLSVPLKYKTARDCYASTLQRAGFSDDIIDEMMGHAPVHLMAAHYKGFINKEMLFERNKCLVGINHSKKKTVNRKLA